MRLCPNCGGHIRRTKWDAHQANHQYVMTRSLNNEIPTRARDINAEMPRGVSIINCRVENCGTGVLLKNSQGVLVDGMMFKNTPNPIVDIGGRNNVFRRLRRIK